jgi:hypothetical protein
VGIDRETAPFAVEAIRRWWSEMGKPTCPRGERLLIVADGAELNGRRSRPWQVVLQGLANETGLQVSVCHFPPGTSKWHKVEHRLFCHVTKNWRGGPWTSRVVVVSSIGSTTRTTGLTEHPRLDENDRLAGAEAPGHEHAGACIRRDTFRGEWNYTIFPHRG